MVTCIHIHDHAHSHTVRPHSDVHTHIIMHIKFIKLKCPLCMLYLITGGTGHASMALRLLSYFTMLLYYQ